MAKPYVTNAQALKACQVLQDYYSDLVKTVSAFGLDPFCDRMIVSLGEEIKKIPTRDSLKKRFEKPQRHAAQ